jgi:exopolyphosphatase/guanosine-5'-triphosphate,3'-diphosphate pyrophosphatase
MAALVRGHRRKFPREVFAALPKGMTTSARRLCVLLRLAVLLHRSRSRQALPPLRLSVNGQSLGLMFPPGWLDGHPLTRADLDQEAQYLKKAGFQLDVAQANGADNEVARAEAAPWERTLAS